MAVNVCIAPRNTVAEDGETVTVTGGTVMVVVAVPVMEAVTVSVAAMVWLPTVFSVAEKVPAPFVSVELAGSTAWLSVLEKCTVPE